MAEAERTDVATEGEDGRMIPDDDCLPREEGASLSGEKKPCGCLYCRASRGDEEADRVLSRRALLGDWMNNCMCEGCGGPGIQP